MDEHNEQDETAIDHDAATFRVRSLVARYVDDERSELTALDRDDR